MNAGPYETEREALRASLWEQQGRKLDQRAMNLADLAAECSGIRLGAYDKRIIEWLANYEPSTVAVICGLISRARQAGPR
jgi:hypothetical protein